MAVHSAPDNSSNHKPRPSTSWVSSFGFLCLLAWLGGCSLASLGRKRNGGAVQPGPFALLRSGSCGVDPSRSPHHAPHVGPVIKIELGLELLSADVSMQGQSLFFDYVACAVGYSPLRNIPCETEKKELQQFRTVTSKRKSKKEREIKIV